MRKPNSRYLLLLICLGCLYSCTKTYTSFYEDADTPGQAIFSNTSNAVMTCSINGRPWRTIENRSVLIGSGGRTDEVTITRIRNTGAFDSLIINWSGYFPPETVPGGGISLAIRVPTSFSISDLSGWQGRRFQIDTSNTGYFATGITAINPDRNKGNGSIYFHTCSFDSVSAFQYTGKMAGLFEADFPGVTIKNGRFDHFFDDENFQF